MAKEGIKEENDIKQESLFKMKLNNLFVVCNQHKENISGELISGVFTLKTEAYRVMERERKSLFREWRQNKAHKTWKDESLHELIDKMIYVTTLDKAIESIKDKIRDKFDSCYNEDY